MRMDGANTGLEFASMRHPRELDAPARSLDARGTRCPTPILRAKLALTRLKEGELLHVAATDPHATIDFQAFCARTGHELVRECRDEEDVLHFYIRRTAGARA